MRGNGKPRLLLRATWDGTDVSENSLGLLQLLMPPPHGPALPRCLTREQRRPVFLFSPGFPGGSVAKNLPAKQETQVRSLGREDPLEKEMATHSSLLAWRIPWIKELGGLQFMGPQRVGQNLATQQPCSHQDVHINVHNIFIHNHEKPEDPVTINRGRDTRSVERP